MAEAVDLRRFALNCLSRREYCRCELKNRLLSRDNDPVQVEQLLDHLEQSQFLSEQRYVTAVVERRIAAGYGPERIAAELKHRGADTDCVVNYLNKFGEEWTELAQCTLDKYFIDKNNMDDDMRLARLQRFLFNRGFDEHTVARVADRFASSTF